MPMPREEDDDLFHDVNDVDFDDDDASDEKPKKKKKAAKKKTAKKKTAKKKAAKKKTTKKKAKRVAVPEDDTKVKKAPARRKKQKTTKAADEDQADFGAGLFDDEDAPKKKAEKRSKNEAPPVDDPKPEAAEAGEDEGAAEEATDEYGRPEPVANYVVHVYELGRLKRTIDRDFTPELAEKYAVEFSRTAKKYGRKAVAGKKDTQPAKELVEE